MISPHRGNIAIVGAAESESLGHVPGSSALGLHANAAHRALADAGLTLADVDGFATAAGSPIEAAHALGITPRWIDGTMVGGCSPLVHVRHAAAAIAAGLADVVLISHGESGRSRRGTPIPAPVPDSLAGQFERPYGAVAPYSTFTLPARRFLVERGLGPEALAEPVYAQRIWAGLNPRALRREPITREQIMAAPMIADPFTRDMCCVVTDGGGALVLCSAERARELNLRSAPVYLHGSGEATAATMVSQMGDIGSFAPFRRSSQHAFEAAGIGTAEIDHLMVYDAFAHLPLYGLEDLGFTGFGESADFIAEGHTLPGGRLPMNTNGGGLSYTHTGMYGIFAILESVRQLRGEAAAQVAGVTTSLVQGVGLYFAAAATLVLSSESSL